MNWEIVVGIETHVQLATQSKIFSAASTAFGSAPNTQVAAVDCALPGVLPVLNYAAVECAIRFGLAVGGEVAEHSVFARKNYFYPDLPKGYQISQYEHPVVTGGGIRIATDDAKSEKLIRLTRAHLEEDAGKSLHEDFHGCSGIDLNRAGSGLLEIVTEPDISSADEAVAYARSLHALVRWIGICDGNMQEGSFRCDANVSVRRGGSELGTRHEIKNLNSFRFLKEAIEFEARQQIEILQDGGSIEQATVLFDPDSGETRLMRSKADAHDYRYFPDPDLLPLVIKKEWVEQVRNDLPELPQQKRARFVDEYGLSSYDAGLLCTDQATADYYESCVEAAGGKAAAKICANWISGDLSARLKRDEKEIADAPVSPKQLGELVGCIAKGTISNSVGKQVFEKLCAQPGGNAREIIAAENLQQINDSSILEKMVDEIIEANPGNVAEFKAGKAKALNALVGQVMKAAGGKANPQQVNALLCKKLA